jgi:hypothetical protein
LRSPSFIEISVQIHRMMPSPHLSSCCPEGLFLGKAWTGDAQLIARPAQRFAGPSSSRTEPPALSAR